MFPGFDYTPSQIKKYAEAAGIFSLLLTDGSVVHFTPQDKGDFKDWLKANGVADMKS